MDHYKIFDVRPPCITLLNNHINTEVDALVWPQDIPFHYPYRDWSQLCVDLPHQLAVHAKDPACWQEQAVEHPPSSLPLGAGSTHPLHSNHSPTFSLNKFSKNQDSMTLRRKTSSSASLELHTKCLGE
jgi:hypothetical protein